MAASNAGRRIAKHSTDWAKLTQVVTEQHRPALESFRTKSEEYERKVGGLPSSLPSIDFESYRKRLPANLIAAVDALEKQYKSYEVPPAKDTQNLMEDIRKQQEKEAADAKVWVAGSQQRIAELKEKIAWWDKIPPTEHMLRGEFNYYFPEKSEHDPRQAPWKSAGLFENEFHPDELKIWRVENYGIHGWGGPDYREGMEDEGEDH